MNHNQEQENGLRRYLIVMADDSLRCQDVIDGDILEWLFATSANVLAPNEDAAMIAATEEMLDERFVPVVALPVERIRELLSILETCPVSPSNPVIYNEGSHEDEDEASKTILPEAERLLRRRHNR